METEVLEMKVEQLETVEYPLSIQYCGACTLPLEYCEYSGMSDKCYKWLEESLPDEFAKVSCETDETAEKKRQKRGGKGAKTAEKVDNGKKSSQPTKVTLQRAARGKNKSVTVIKGLASYGVDLKVAAKFFAGRFACGSSVTATDEIVVQGDVKEELIDILTQKWKQITEDSIEDLGDQKR